MKYHHLKVHVFNAQIFPPPCWSNWTLPYTVLYFTKITTNFLSLFGCPKWHFLMLGSYIKSWYPDSKSRFSHFSQKLRRVGLWKYRQTILAFLNIFSSAADWSHCTGACCMRLQSPKFFSSYSTLHHTSSQHLIITITLYQHILTSY